MMRPTGPSPRCTGMRTSSCSAAMIMGSEKTKVLPAGAGWGRGVSGAHLPGLRPPPSADPGLAKGRAEQGLAALPQRMGNRG